jgi:D-amino-acid dehydrogenase
MEQAGISGRRAVVIGGGVIGAACAYYLARAGWVVTILEKGRFGRGASHGNCGYISPSHVLPLAEPGVVARTLKGMLHADSPFYVKPRMDPGLWAWMLRFARRANQRDMLSAAVGLAPLLRSTASLYEQILSTEPIEAEWEKAGCWFIYRTPEAMAGYEATDRLMREKFDMPAARYDGNQLADMEPALKPGLAGGWLYESDSHVRPDKLMSGWRAVLETMGVQIRQETKAEGFVEQGGSATAVRTRQGEVPAEAFVVAAGAWTPEFGLELGAKIPIQPGKGYSITMRRPAVCPNRPMIFQEHKVAITPMKSGYRIGSTMEFAGYDDSLNPRRLGALRRGADLYFREPVNGEVEEEWCGWRPMTWDSLPIIDRSPRLRNAWVAAGHSMLGLTLAPATGRLIAELVGERAPHVDPAPYAIRRFG